MVHMRTSDGYPNLKTQNPGENPDFYQIRKWKFGYNNPKTQGKNPTLLIPEPEPTPRNTTWTRPEPNFCYPNPSLNCGRDFYGTAILTPSKPLYEFANHLSVIQKSHLATLEPRKYYYFLGKIFTQRNQQIHTILNIKEIKKKI